MRAFWALFILFLAFLRLLLPLKTFSKAVSLLPKKLTAPVANALVDANSGDPADLWRRIQDNLDAVGYDKKAGSRFSNSEEEVDAALKKVPTLAPYRPYMLRWVQRHRAEVGLQV